MFYFKIVNVRYLTFFQSRTIHADSLKNIVGLNLNFASYSHLIVDIGNDTYVGSGREKIATMLEKR